ncbi:hypothetical protein A8F95_17700 [Bacillus wudalianchiensis]|uniref:Uncharacterized protein n=1 Tax=Pseudobacillus wudalianchiensis TaxID=1743143 RepID=A0A1B9AAQ6_9BACI|nr:hypothetical protein A8F95_17700 [Bacillus wudalianchiensis]
MFSISKISQVPNQKKCDKFVKKVLKFCENGYIINLQTFNGVIFMNPAITKKLNKQALIFAAVHSLFFLNLAFDFVQFY